MRKMIIRFMAAVMAGLIFIIAGCGSSSDNASGSSNKKVIRLGVRVVRRCGTGRIIARALGKNGLYFGCDGL